MCKKDDFQLEVLEKATIHCADVERLLGDITDGEIMPSLNERLRGHIDECEFCCESEKNYRWVVEQAKMLKPRPMPSDVSKRLRLALNEKLGLSLDIDNI